jgi:hypothetical protein
MTCGTFGGRLFKNFEGRLQEGGVLMLGCQTTKSVVAAVKTKEMQEKREKREKRLTGQIDRPPIYI